MSKKLLGKFVDFRRTSHEKWYPFYSMKTDVDDWNLVRICSGTIIAEADLGYLVFMDEEIPSEMWSYTYSGAWGSTPLPVIIDRDTRIAVEAAVKCGTRRFVMLQKSMLSKIRIRDNDKENSQMATNAREPFFDMLKSDSEDAAYRVASDKIADGVKGLVAMAIASKMGEGPTSESVMAVLESPIGKALIQVASGYVLTYAPQKIAGDARVKKLAKEFRVAGMAAAGGFAFDELFSGLGPVVSSALEMLPGGAEYEDSKVRVNNTGGENVEELPDAPADEATVLKAAGSR